MSLLLDIVFLYYNKLISGLWAKSLLLKPLYVEVHYYNKVVFRRVLYFVVEE
jgi:hypothetical protein